ncbi:hypothetical protein ZIOFF_006119 [Zingiber officinale]|uniref:Uncharacterized protein n=1 Tax=Zingiber officinale TaxID=94328 RepID=A0A8J5IDS8_ZINOF|nr:hypothetical protein ZIOFF_006119 [Zingiber officinale]
MPSTNSHFSSSFETLELVENNGKERSSLGPASHQEDGAFGVVSTAACSGRDTAGRGTHGALGSHASDSAIDIGTIQACEIGVGNIVLAITSCRASYLTPTVDLLQQGAIG